MKILRRELRVAQTYHKWGGFIRHANATLKISFNFLGSLISRHCHSRTTVGAWVGRAQVEHRGQESRNGTKGSSVQDVKFKPQLIYHLLLPGGDLNNLIWPDMTTEAISMAQTRCFIDFIAHRCGSHTTKAMTHDATIANRFHLICAARNMMWRWYCGDIAALALWRKVGRHFHLFWHTW